LNQESSSTWCRRTKRSAALNAAIQLDVFRAVGEGREMLHQSLATAPHQNAEFEFYAISSL